MDRIRMKNHRGFRMDLWYAYGASGKLGRDTYNYKVLTPTGVLFAGKGYQPSPFEINNKEMILDGLLDWICLRPGDTDREYFDSYTPEQLVWANSNKCEMILSELPT